MPPLEEILELDVSPALAAVGDIDSALTGAVEAFGGELQAALEAINVAPVEQSLAEVDTTSITQSLEESAAAGGVAVTQSIEEGADAAAPQVTFDDVDASAVTDAIEEAAAGADVSTLPEVGEKAREAGGGLTEFAGAGLQAKGAAGLLDTTSKGLSGSLGGVASKAGPAGAAITAAAVAAGVLFNSAAEAEQATFRMGQTFGPLASQVERVNIGGLNEDLSDLAVRLGANDERLRLASAALGDLGRTSGASNEQIAETSEQVLALASQIAATRPELGSADEIVERLGLTLARGGRFAARFGLDLQAAEIESRALQDTGKATAEELTIFDKAAAGAAISVEKLGDRIGTDIAKGTDQPIFAIKQLRTQFGELVEELGQPFVEPVSQSLGALTSSVSLLNKEIPGLGISFARLANPLAYTQFQVEGLQIGIQGLSASLTGNEVALQQSVEAQARMPGPIGDTARALLEQQTTILTRVAAQKEAVKADEAATLALSNLGLSADSLAGKDINLVALSDASAAMASAFAENIPSASASLGQFATDTEINIGKVLEDLTKQNLAFASFLPNLVTIVQKGGQDLAVAIEALGPQEGAAFAAATASATPTQIRALEAQIDERNRFAAGAEFQAGRFSAQQLAAGATDPNSLRANFEAGRRLVEQSARGVRENLKAAEQAGKETGEGYARGIESKGSRAFNAAKSFAEGALRALKQVFNLGSPSKVTFGFGSDVGEGLALGILDTRRQVERAAQSLARSALINPSTALRAIPVSATQPAQSQPSAPVVAGGTTVEQLHVHEAPDPRATIFRINTELAREATR